MVILGDCSTLLSHLQMTHRVIKNQWNPIQQVTCHHVIANFAGDEVSRRTVHEGTSHCRLESVNFLRQQSADDPAQYITGAAHTHPRVPREVQLESLFAA